MNLYVECRKSKKDNGGFYHCLCADVGYRVIVLSYDKGVCAELLNVSPRKLAEMKEGEKIAIK